MRHHSRTACVVSFRAASASLQKPSSHAIWNTSQQGKKSDFSHWMQWNFHRGLGRSWLLLVFKRSPYTCRTKFSSSFSVWTIFREKDPTPCPAPGSRGLPNLFLAVHKDETQVFFCLLFPLPLPHTLVEEHKALEDGGIDCRGTGSAGLAARRPRTYFKLDTTLMKRLEPNRYMETTSRN